WRLGSLLKGRLGFDIIASIEGQPADVVVELGFGNSVHVHNLNASIPAQRLLPLIGGLNLPLGGTLQAQIDYLHIKNNQPRQAVGTAQLKQAAWHLMRPPLELGSVALKLSTEDTQIMGKLLNEAGSPVELEGEFNLDNAGQYQFTARLKPLTNADPRLANLMQGLGQKDAQGWYRVKTQGALAQ
ncbi:MAG: type II secretion system protein N, partial [Salinisphaeraceae bacterium]|nr:type II secretion system protein N [Salinisphaeraceae bacterium]